MAEGAVAGGAAAACRKLWESRGSSHSLCGAWLGAPCPRGPPSCWGGQAHAVPWQSVIPNPGGDFAVPSPGLAFGAEFYQQQLSKINKRACACQ